MLLYSESQGESLKDVHADYVKYDLSKRGIIFK